jgi:hypothetical protein
MAFVHAPGWQPPTGNLIKATLPANAPRFGAYAVRFSDSSERDLSGEFFTSETNFGPRNGDGSPTLIHHGNVIAPGLEAFASVILPDAKVHRDSKGLFASTQLNLEDRLHAAIADLILSGAFRWSSGSRYDLVLKEPDGKILRWPPLEFSLTPTPAEPRLPRLTQI